MINSRKTSRWAARRWTQVGLGTSACVLLGAAVAPSCAAESDEIATAAAALTPAPGEVCVKLQRGVSAVADAQISANAPTTSYGASTVLATGGSLVSKSLIRFDLSPIPANATITRAFLRVGQATFGGSGSVLAHAVTAPWNEATVTHASFGNAVAAAPFATSVLGGGVMPPLYFDIQAQLQAWVSGAQPNHGLQLDMGPTGQYQLRSSEDATPTLRPTVELCYLDKCAGVTCAASDACHAAGTCDPATGQCSNPAAPDGTACDDGDLCTTGDACTAGACGGAPVVCSPLDACHDAGVCNAATGACSNPPNDACHPPPACTPAHAFRFPQSGMVAHWEFDDGASTVTDSTGNGNTGSFVGGASYSSAPLPPEPGNVASVALDTTGHLVSIPSSPSITIPGSFTVSAWARLNSTTGEHNIISKDDPSVVFSNYNLHVVNNRAYFAVAFQTATAAGGFQVASPVSTVGGLAGCDGGGCYVSSTALIIDSTHPAGTWRLLTGVYDDTNKSLTIYVDCTSSTTASFVTTGIPFTSGQTVQLGKRKWNANSWLLGGIDDVAIWNRALSSAEIVTR